MKKYVLTRILKALFSIFVVVSIVIVMVYTMLDTNKAFKNDSAYQKLKGAAKTSYKYNKLEELGYLDYKNLADMCKEASDDISACLVFDSPEAKKVMKEFEDKGYTIEVFTEENDKGKTNTSVTAYHYYNSIELLANFYSKLIKIEHPWNIQDPANPDLERKYYLGLDHNNIPAVMCSGCTHKYQLYFNTSFPFIHQNAISLDFGQSYPYRSGIPTLEVINTGQGKLEPSDQKFSNGTTSRSPILQHTCEYKYSMDHLDEKRFDDNYADCMNKYDSPSMVSTSYLFGILGLILAYAFAVPFGIAMAQNKGKLIDKIGIVWINLLVSVPSLALIFFLKYFGNFFGLPDKFPQLGFGNIKSYILPIIILALLSTSSLMMWIRRYMVDQSNADYVKFARAKGLSQKEIFRKHILKNAIIPIVNGIPSSIILCISGAVITETVFAIPGMGKMLPDAIKQVNNRMVITLTFIFTALSVFAVLIGDLLMTVVDPRIQLAAKGDD